MAKRNWKAISELSDYRTRLAISLATDPEIVACFERGFPHLFEEGDDEGPLRIPLSTLVEATREWLQDSDKIDAELGVRSPGPTHEEEFSNFWMHCGNEHNANLNLPIAYCWEIGDEVPESLLQDLVGQKAQAGMLVYYMGRQYMVLTLDFEDFHTNGWPKIGSVFTEPPKVDRLMLVDADFIDLNT